MHTGLKLLMKCMFYRAGGFRHDQRRVLGAPRVETDQHEEGRGPVLTCSYRAPTLYTHFVQPQLFRTFLLNNVVKGFDTINVKSTLIFYSNDCTNGMYVPNDVFALVIFSCNRRRLRQVVDLKDLELGIV